MTGRAPAMHLTPWSVAKSGMPGSLWSAASVDRQFGISRVVAAGVPTLQDARGG